MGETVWSLFCTDLSCSRNEGNRCSSLSIPAIINPESCINHAVIVSIDVVFLLTIFSIFVYDNFASKKYPSPQRRQQVGQKWIISIIFNGVLGLVYFGLGVWMVFQRIRRHVSVLPLHGWMVMVFQGFTWLLLSVTVCRKNQQRMVKICSLLAFVVSAIQCCSSLWEVTTDSMFSVKMVLAILTLPGSILLLFCAFRRNDGDSVPDFGTDVPYETLSGEEAGEDVTPFEKAGFFSKMSFWWLNPIMKKGNNKIIGDDDIPQLRYSDRAETCYAKFMEQLRRKKGENSDSPSLFSVLFSCHKREILISGFFALIKVLTLLSGPLLLKGFIQVAGSKSELRFHGYALTVTLFLVKSLESVAGRQWYFRSRLIGIQVRSMLSAAIYRKQLQLSNAAKSMHSSGEIVNYVTIDAYKLGEFPYWFHQSWVTCLQLCLATVIAIETVGLATVAALFGIILTMFASSPLAKLQLTYHSKLVKQQDKRLKAITEALANMKVLKLYAWETHFKKAIEGLRKVELWTLTVLLISKACNLFVFWSSPMVVSALTFWTCYFAGVPINAANVFTFLAILRCIQDPIRMIPDIATEFVEAKVSLDRISRFLDSPELENKNVRKQSKDPESNVSIVIRCSGISWDSDPSSKSTLTDINLLVKPGEKVAICGEVGSGKSTLLAAVLGEVPKINGTVRVYGKLAYVSQNAWMQTGTIRDNILFGSAMDSVRYQEVLRRCSLVKDLDMLPYGDFTEIGERGVNLSGGQKQRVQLARALYQDADIYLLDDPFSAVDAHTATSLFNEYVMEALTGKTVLLVTHQVDFLPAFNSILLMSAGQLLRADTYDKLLATCQEFQELVNAHKDTVSSERRQEKVPASTTSDSKEEIQKIYGKEKPKAPVGDQLIKKEEREAGDTGFKPYRQYLSHGNGYLNCFFNVGSHFLFIVGQIVQNYLLAAEIQNSHVSRVRLFTIYCIIGCILAVFLVFRSVFVVKLAFEASDSIFSKLLRSLFRAPMSFYDSTPLGRILSRVSYDLSVVDLEVALKLTVASGNTINAYCTVGLLAFLSWPLLFIIVPMVYLLTVLQRYYFNAAKEFMRIAGTTKSMLVSHLAESISGAVTIRAFAEEDRFFAKNLKLIDRNASPHFHNFSANEWLIQYLEIPCAIVLSASALAMILMPLGSSGPGFVGMALSYGLAMNLFFTFAVQYQCFISESIISVERLEQYTNIPSEAPEVIESNRPKQDWPTTGKVEFCNLKVRYQANSPFVLQGISCVIEGGHKVGIVGRTGSGKTTLTSTLFRLVEPTEGRVMIDGVDISTIGLHDLRSHIGIIPQDPTLFNGSVRYNLDPLSQYTDSAIWEVLEKCQLREVIEQKKDGLSALVAQDGSNWSMGQRQLFCLGRALLKRSKILVLDEATASIDNATDAILQKTIRTEFAEWTVITVAHRIPTVMDSTKVLALSDGKMVEYDEPAKLMNKEDSLFAQLVKEYWSRAANTDTEHLQ